MTMISDPELLLGHAHRDEEEARSEVSDPLSDLSRLLLREVPVVVPQDRVWTVLPEARTDLISEALFSAQDKNARCGPRHPAEELREQVHVSDPVFTSERTPHGTPDPDDRHPIRVDHPRCT